MSYIQKGKIRNARPIIDTSTGIIYENGKIAAEALGINKGYFSGMMCGCFKNKTTCKYLTER
jgi:hypothetical protein